jgi:hypothetical protein
MAAPNGRETAPEGREALIEQLEELGYDTLADVPEDWRDSKSDDELKSTLEAFSGGGAEPSDPPDISELVEAIREAVNAADAYHDAHPNNPRTIRDDAGTRWLTAFDRLRTLLTEIDTAMEAFS